MTSRRIHLLSAVPTAFVAVAVGYHPAYAAPLVLGTFLPEIDAVDRRFHRSWLAHTCLLPAAVYWALRATGAFAAVPALETAVHFLALGTVLHLLADYVYPRGMDHAGAEWPVRPSGFSAPWGLLWMGMSWTLQWFLYLEPAFLPWLFGV